MPRQRYDIDKELPPFAQHNRVISERLRIAAVGYWAIREKHGHGSRQEQDALDDLMRVTRQAFLLEHPQEVDEAGDLVGSRKISHDGPTDTWSVDSRFPGGTAARNLIKMRRRMAVERALLGG